MSDEHARKPSVDEQKVIGDSRLRPETRSEKEKRQGGS